VQVAATLNNLAEILDQQRKFEESEPMYLRALALREKAMGPDHPAVAGVAASLGAHYSARGELDKAEAWLRRALAGYEKSLGPEHPEVGGALKALAHFFAAQGRTAAAEAYYGRALRIFEKSFGPPGSRRHAGIVGAA
jgi:tetratricopeptide (TPR) repeat protein